MTQYPNNIFLDAFKKFSNQDSYSNFYKNFNFGNFDNSNMSDLAQKNMDAMMKASQVNAENTQAIFRRAGEVCQKQMGEAVEATRDFMSCSNPEQAMQKQQQYLKNATSNLINNSKEMVEMYAKSLMEAFDIYSRRFSENMNVAQAEVKKAK